MAVMEFDHLDQFTYSNKNLVEVMIIGSCGSKQRCIVHFSFIIYLLAYQLWYDKQEITKVEIDDIIVSFHSFLHAF